MVDISKYYDSDYITVDYVKTLGAEERKGTIVGVGEPVKLSYGDLWKIPVDLNGQVKEVTLFNKSFEYLKQSYGTDTKNWLSKPVIICIELNTKNTEVVVVKPVNI